MVQLPNDEYSQLVGERDSLAAELTRLRRDNAALLAAAVEYRDAVEQSTASDDVVTMGRYSETLARYSKALAEFRAAIAQAQEPQS